MLAPADQLRQILHARQLAACGGVAEVRRKLSQLVGGGRVAVRRRGLRCRLQVAGDLLGYCRVLNRVRLL